MALPVYPFEGERYLGSVIRVAPTQARANLPRSLEPSARSHHGSNLEGGQVGEFVLIEAPDFAVLGRITEVVVPERDRSRIEEGWTPGTPASPFGVVLFLATIDLASGELLSGVRRYPRLGCRVFACHPHILRAAVEQISSEGPERQVRLDVAAVPAASNLRFSVSPERLFGHHCAVLGATGGGKSWSLARLAQQCARHHCKVLLIDATGEYRTLRGSTRHATLGGSADSAETEVAFPYRRLTESDLFAMFRPRGQSQAPKLRAAIKSLKLLQRAPELANEYGVLQKARQPKAPFEAAYAEHREVIEGRAAIFDISLLAPQIEEECVWPTDFDRPENWGRHDEKD